MLIFAPKDEAPSEPRVSLVPDTVKRLASREIPVTIESGLGSICGIPDAAYEAAGAQITADPRATLAAADMVLRLNKPEISEVERMKEGSLYIGYLEPFGSPDLVRAFARKRVNAISMEMIPRTTIAQKMDALSSQANLAGYVAVITAAERLNKILPMMMTPAGTLAPARVFIIGCGVAGLQAIATAKRLGARVDAFDTRPVVEEQVKSLGAKFVKVDLGETGEAKGGYAKALTEEQLQKQQAAMAKVIAQSDIVITTAQVFGRKAPVIVTEEMVKGMQPGSVVVDLAVETGGNVACSKAGEEVLVNGVLVVGIRNLPGQVAVHASQMYSANIGNLVEHFWDKGSKSFRLNLDDEIMDGCLVVYNGEVRNENVKAALG
jgi:NAD(P) transhydrogenase subunit alpha